jgi:WhiB family redox-sensing transcriptional regulator
MAIPSLATDTEWTAEASCRRADAVHFYPPSSGERRDEKRRRENAARVLCGRCPVKAACLDYSLTVQEPHGIWGGMNELERRRLLRKRAAEVRATAGAF